MPVHFFKKEMVFGQKKYEIIGNYLFNGDFLIHIKFFDQDQKEGCKEHETILLIKTQIRNFHR